MQELVVESLVVSLRMVMLDVLFDDEAYMPPAERDDRKVPFRPVRTARKPQDAFDTGWSPVSWGSIDELFVNLTMPTIACPPGRARIPSRLEQDVNHVPVLVHGPPQILPLPLDGHEEFVQVPGIAHPASAPPQPPRVVDPERLRSLPNCLVGDRDAPLSQQILDAPFPGRDTQALAKGASNLGGSSIRRLSSWTECPSNSAALASEIAPSARARKHRRSKRIGRSPGIAHGSL